MTYYISRSFPLKQKTCLHVFMSKNMFSSLNADSTWGIALVQYIIAMEFTRIDLYAYPRLASFIYQRKRDNRQVW